MRKIKNKIFNFVIGSIIVIGTFAYFNKKDGIVNNAATLMEKGKNLYFERPDTVSNDSTVYQEIFKKQNTNESKCKAHPKTAARQII